MFRKIIHPAEPGAAAEIAMEACKKRMKVSKWIIFTLGTILILGFGTLWVAPDRIGSTGKRVLGVLVAMIIAQGVNCIVEYQRLQKLDRLSK